MAISTSTSGNSLTLLSAGKAHQHYTCLSVICSPAIADGAHDIQGPWVEAIGCCLCCSCVQISKGQCCDILIRQGRFGSNTTCSSANSCTEYQLIGGGGGGDQQKWLLYCHGSKLAVIKLMLLLCTATKQRGCRY